MPVTEFFAAHEGAAHLFPARHRRHERLWQPRAVARPGAQQAVVPVDVAASGPKVIEFAARTTERVTFAVGADPCRCRMGDRGGA